MGTKKPETVSPPPQQENSWKKRFRKWHSSIGKPAFGPEYFTHMLAVMADTTRDTDERTLAWARFRSWGNYNDYACRGRLDSRPLTQRDCALDLAHLAAGRPIEWIDGERERNSHAFTGADTLDKSCLSRSFARNKECNLIDLRGHRIYPVVDPAAAALAATSGETPPKVLRSEQLYKQFLELPEVVNSREFQDWTVARARAAELSKVVLSRYREWRRHERAPHVVEGKTPDDKNQKNLKRVNPSPAPPPNLPAPAEPPTTTPRKAAAAAANASSPPANTPETDAAPIAAVSAAFDQLAGPIQDARVHSFISECRQHTPDITAAEIVGVMHEKAKTFSRTTTSPAGLLLRTVPELCGGNTLTRVRKSIDRHRQIERADLERQAAEYRAMLSNPEDADFHATAREQIALIERRLQQLQEPSQ